MKLMDLDMSRETFLASAKLQYFESIFVVVCLLHKLFSCAHVPRSGTIIFASSYI